MNIFLWSLQGILALFMLLPGFLKLANNHAELIKKENGRTGWE